METEIDFEAYKTDWLHCRWLMREGMFEHIDSNITYHHLTDKELDEKVYTIWVKDLEPDDPLRTIYKEVMQLVQQQEATNKEE